MIEGFSSGKEKDAGITPIDLGRPLEEASGGIRQWGEGESDIYEFKGEDGGLMIRKVLKESIGKSQEELEKMITQLGAQYELLKKHLGNRIVSTEYVTITLESGLNALTILQEKVSGVRFDKMSAPAGSELAERFIDEISTIELGVRKAQKDPEIKDLFGENPRAGGAFNNATLNVNQIWTEEGKLKIIDWT